MIKNNSYMRHALRIAIGITLLGLSLATMPSAQAGLITTDLNSGLNPTNLVNKLLGSGVEVSNVKYYGVNHAAGTFSGGTGIIGFEDGIILNTGKISDVIGPNKADATTTDNGQPGDSDLDSLIPGYQTFDRTVLEFDFIPNTNILIFDYVFGSEEYNEYVNSSYNDIFGFFLNGKNIALIPGTTNTPVSINNVNGGKPYGSSNAKNKEYFRNNDLNDGGGSIDTELDGLTVVLKVTANVNPGVTNHIKLAIADAGDSVLDSAVFIRSGSFASSQSSTFGGRGSNQNVLFSDDPVNLGTGNYIYQHQDIFIPGRGLPLTIARSYNSMDSNSGPFGSGWTFNYNLNLAIIAGSGNVLVTREDGRTDTYILNPDGSYSPPSGVFDKLIKNADGSYTLENKDHVKYNFSPQGRLSNITDKNGNQIKINYEDNYITEVIDASGRKLVFTYDNADRIITITDPAGRMWNYAYDMGNLIQYSNPMGEQFSYTYDENHQMTSIIDPNENQIMANTYDEERRTISQSNALGAIYTFDYDVENRETTETDPFDRKKIYSYDEHFWGLSETDQLGNTIYFSYDGNGNRISITNTNGQTTQFTYDVNGDIIQITDPLSHTTSITYDSKDNPISLTDALGRQMFLEYDADSNLIKIINSLSDATVFTYDGHGQIISGTDAKGNTANFAYDTFGNQKTVTNALGNTVAFTYDGVGRLLEITDPDGNKYKLTYDDLDRLISVTYPLGHTASNTYDAAGNRISFTDPAGKVTTYSYNSLNKLVTVTDALGGTVQFNYDAIGNMVSMTDGNGHTTNYVYDPLNRPTSIIDPLGYTASNTYDAVGNRISFTDAAGKLTKYNYDPLNRLVKVTDAMDGSVYYTYDAVGNMMSMMDANDHTTNYAYDPLNRPVSIIDPLGNTASSTYDAVGNVVSSTDANGKTTSYSYDGINCLIKIVYPDGKTVSYGYDARGNRLMMADSQGTTNYQYDELNRLLSVLNPGGQKVGYKYDAVGNRIQLIYPDNKMTSYAYDAANRLIGVTDRNGGITSNTYDPNGNLIGMTYPNSMKAEYVYDEGNRLVELINKNDAQIVSSFTYNMDAVGNRLSVNEYFSGRFEDATQTTNYEYDDLYCLTRVDYPIDKIVQYNYDPMGNRISMITTVDGIDSTVNYAYDAADRLLESGNVIYLYDNNGNLIKKTENSGRVFAYGYDGANRLSSITTLFGAQRNLYTFEYDGDGNRISKTSNKGKSTQFSKYVLDVNSMLPQVLTESDGKSISTYTYGTDLISMTDPKRDEFYYHNDGLGSVRSLSDSKESIKNIYIYDAFGQVQKEMSQVDNDFQFTGEQMDDETGLIYLRARYYDPSVGRFINKDPFMGIGTMTQSLNRYTYTMNNPVNFVDPSGYSGESPAYNPREDIIDIGYYFVSNGQIVESAILKLAEYGDIPINLNPHVYLNPYERALTGYKKITPTLKIIGGVLDIRTVWGESGKELERKGINFWSDAPDILSDYSMIARYVWDNPYEGVESGLYGFSSGGAIAVNSLLEVIPVNTILRLGGQKTFTLTATHSGLSWYSNPLSGFNIMDWSNRW